MVRRIPSLLLGLLGLALIGCASSRASTQDPRAAAPPPPGVVGTQTIARTVPIYSEAAAQTIAAQTVDLRAQVAGTRDQALFKQGTEGRQGQLLLVSGQPPLL